MDEFKGTLLCILVTIPISLGTYFLTKHLDKQKDQEKVVEARIEHCMYGGDSDILEQVKNEWKSDHPFLEDTLLRIDTLGYDVICTANSKSLGFFVCKDNLYNLLSSGEKDSRAFFMSQREYLKEYYLKEYCDEAKIFSNRKCKRLYNTTKVYSNNGGYRSKEAWEEASVKYAKGKFKQSTFEEKCETKYRNPLN